jgi:hypothetical protein
MDRRCRRGAVGDVAGKVANTVGGLLGIGFGAQRLLDQRSATSQQKSGSKRIAPKKTVAPNTLA